MERPPNHLRKTRCQRAEIGDRIVHHLPYLRGNDVGGHHRNDHPDATPQSSHYLQYVVGERPHVAVVELMKLSFFYPSDDKDSDSYDTQEEKHEAAYSMTAIALLESEDQAFIASVTDAVHRHILYQIPAGSTATIRISRNQPIQITLAKDE